MNEVLEWIAVGCCGTSAADAARYAALQVAARGWLEDTGQWVTTVQKPGNWATLQKQKSHSAWLDLLGKRVSSNYGQFARGNSDMDKYTFVTSKWTDTFPGVFVITTDGRALVLTGYDFWKNKPRDAKLLGDFLVKVLVDPRVAQIYDLGSEANLIGKEPARVYSEEDFWVVLENPDLVLAELESITSSVQRLNALKVELAALAQQKAELEAHMALLAQQAQMAVGEQAGTQAELAAAQQQLNTVMQQEAAKLAQASALEQSVSAASKTKTTAWLVGGAALLAVGYLVLRKR